MSHAHSASEPASPDTEFAGDSPLTEEALDQQFDDSFPASDPPSHTPTMGQSGPRGEPELKPTGRRLPSWAPIAAGALALMAVAFSVWRWRRHRNH